MFSAVQSLREIAGWESNQRELRQVQNMLDVKSLNVKPRPLSQGVQHKSRPQNFPSIDPKFRLRLTEIKSVFYS